MKHLILIFTLLASPAFAVLPDEVLSDSVLEGRARALSQELRCVVCQGENIDESNAGIARDLRLLVRELLVDDKTDQQILDFMVSRYGEYVLMRPTWGGANIILYVAGPVLLLFGLLVGFLYARGRATAQNVAGADLSKEEEQRLAELLKD
ncbi:cytochrome C biogenesis protein CcdA [Marinosulfonomonas sp. PRT-SC04]|nr:cytochrome C biogenesis protein CcdA [Marinosulfonomonas sp. PRT-SC04]